MKCEICDLCKKEYELEPEDTPNKDNICKVCRRSATKMYGNTDRTLHNGVRYYRNQQPSVSIPIHIYLEEKKKKAK